MPLYFQAASDSLWPHFVLHSLRLHRCSHKICQFQLLHAIFTDREVHFNSLNKSFTIGVTLGCPQGSPLRTLVWNILISGILAASFSESVHIQAYAEDVVIVLAGSSRRQLEEVDTESLEIISEWAHNHRLKLSLKNVSVYVLPKDRNLKKTEIALLVETAVTFDFCRNLKSGVPFLIRNRFFSRI